MTSESTNVISFRSQAVWKEKKRGNYFIKDPSDSYKFSCPPMFGGSIDDGLSPEELFLSSLATCTLTTILHMCNKLRIEPLSLSVSVDTSLFTDETGDYEFNPINISISMEGDEFLLGRAAELAQKYCLIGKIVKTPLNYEVNINED